ncbi:MAG: QacE [Flavobacterium sp.]|nr:MAG: QacE [Flavobacterium sp.]
METKAQSETLFYQNGNVKVTQSRYITISKTYAMRNISSVQTFQIIKSKTIPILLLIVGILILAFADGKIIGGLLSLLGVIIIVFNNNEYAVRISTNSGEVNSIVSSDKSYIQEIVNALNEAIIHRG